MAPSIRSAVPSQHREEQQQGGEGETVPSERNRGHLGAELVQHRGFEDDLAVLDDRQGASGGVVAIPLSEQRVYGFFRWVRWFSALFS
jgi:hypothetical protein